MAHSLVDISTSKLDSINLSIEVNPTPIDYSKRIKVDVGEKSGLEVVSLWIVAIGGVIAALYTLSQIIKYIKELKANTLVQNQKIENQNEQLKSFNSIANNLESQNEILIESNELMSQFLSKLGENFTNKESITVYQKKQMALTYKPRLKYDGGIGSGGTFTHKIKNWGSDLEISNLQSLTDGITASMNSDSVELEKDQAFEIKLIAPDHYALKASVVRFNVKNAMDENYVFEFKNGALNSEKVKDK